MRKCCFALVLLSLCAWTQSLPTEQPKEAVVALINGRKVTLSEFKRMLAVQDAKMKALAMQQPKAFLDEYALYETVLAQAEKARLDQQSPYKEKLAMARRQILAEAMIDETHNNFPVTTEIAKKFYDENSDMYHQATVKVIFISKTLEVSSLDGEKKKSATAEELKAKAEKVGKEARKGADFVKLAEENSDDPNSSKNGADFPRPIRRTSRDVPQEMRGAVLAAKAGDIVGPVEHATGYYIFKVLTNGQAPFDQVKDDVVKELKDAGLKHWLEEVKKNSSVSIENEALLQEATKEK
jgi:parvulin-like peptidyl-prolyl isomerase